MSCHKNTYLNVTFVLVNFTLRQISGECGHNNILSLIERHVNHQRAVLVAHKHRKRIAWTKPIYFGCNIGFGALRLHFSKALQHFNGFPGYISLKAFDTSHHLFHQFNLLRV